MSAADYKVLLMVAVFVVTVLLGTTVWAMVSDWYSRRRGSQK